MEATTDKVNEEGQEIIRVRSVTDVRQLSGSIINSYTKNQAKIESSENEIKEIPIVLRIIGAGALNQAVKGVISSNAYFGKLGQHVAIIPSFISLDANTTAIELKVEIRKILK